MPKSDEDLQKHTLFLYRGDYEKLREVYPEVGAAKVVRNIVRAYLKQIETSGAVVDAKVEIKI